MFENIAKFFKKLVKAEQQETHSKDTAKERLHLVLMQDRANVSADFLELMKQEIIEVIKKYIEVDDKAIDVRLTNKTEEDGTNGSPFLYANIPIVRIKNEAKPNIQKDEENSNNTENIDKENNKKENITDEVKTEESNSLPDENKNDEEKVEEVETKETENNKEEKTEEIDNTKDTGNKKDEKEDTKLEDTSNNEEKVEQQPLKKEKKKGK
jgi:cell division topological specificity factor